MSVGNTPLQYVFGWLQGAGSRNALSPAGFYPVIGTLLPWLTIAAGTFGTLGLFLGITVAQADARHGGLLPIALIHVTAAWITAGLFILTALWAGAALLLRAKLFAMMAQALAPSGAMFALMALGTGCLWSKPIWGAWWDIRLTPGFVLLLLYAAIMAFRIAAPSSRQADRITALIALPGLAAVPGVLASAASWQAFHGSAPAAWPFVPEHSAGMLALLAGFWMYATAMALRRLRCVILERERHSYWVTQQTSGSE